MTGTIEYLGAGAFAVDYSFGRPAISDMLAIGTQAAIRYICKDNAATHGKLWSLDEGRRLADAGILQLWNYEQDEGLTWRGATAGHDHGKVAADWVHRYGYPQGLPIPVSTDATTSTDKFPAIRDFMEAFNYEVSQVYGAPEQDGHYYGTPLLQYLEDRGVSRLNWMAMATSWSSPLGETDRVHVRQKGYVLGVCDANYVRRPTPFWNYNGEPIVPQEEDMTEAQAAQLQTIYNFLFAPTKTGQSDLANTIQAVTFNQVLGLLRAPEFALNATNSKVDATNSKVDTVADQVLGIMRAPEFALNFTNSKVDAVAAQIAGLPAATGGVTAADVYEQARKADTDVMNTASLSIDFQTGG